ncbi:hypothetical protein CDAR_442781 [Caerostris darwini]|uniref:Uncharacterized protein n=1 Tax=Caerostris darwini TaxID=1538125 RepID=A0AAV4VQ94_9ARAC|nr:hypothetical protein CDAR_442781 [Caerostris darwini]
MQQQFSSAFQVRTAQFLNPAPKTSAINVPTWAVKINIWSPFPLKNVPIRDERSLNINTARKSGKLICIYAPKLFRKEDQVLPQVNSRVTCKLGTKWTPFLVFRSPFHLSIYSVCVQLPKNQSKKSLKPVDNSPRIRV